MTQILFRRWLSRLANKKSNLGGAHRLCRVIWKVPHDGVRSIDKGLNLNPKALRERRRRLVAIHPGAGSLYGLFAVGVRGVYNLDHAG